MSYSIFSTSPFERYNTFEDNHDYDMKNPFQCDRDHDDDDFGSCPISSKQQLCFQNNEKSNLFSNFNQINDSDDAFKPLFQNKMLNFEESNKHVNPSELFQYTAGATKCSTSDLVTKTQQASSFGTQDQEVEEVQEKLHV